METLEKWLEIREHRIALEAQREEHLRSMMSAISYAVEDFEVAKAAGLFTEYQLTRLAQLDAELALTDGREKK